MKKLKMLKDSSSAINLKARTSTRDFPQHPSQPIHQQFQTCPSPTLVELPKPALDVIATLYRNLALTTFETLCSRFPNLRQVILDKTKQATITEITEVLTTAKAKDPNFDIDKILSLTTLLCEKFVQDNSLSSPVPTITT